MTFTESNVLNFGAFGKMGKTWFVTLPRLGHMPVLMAKLRLNDTPLMVPARLTV
jgi:hypothetical protein